MNIIEQLYNIFKENPAELTEEIAILLFYTNGGIDEIPDDQLKDFVGSEKRPQWADCAEFNQDDYRHQAKKVIEYFKMKVFGIEKKDEL